ncbi:hypothetical protein [uncultured Cloacibacillus sp.]|uniref:hypothetical protein n=1 Tax=uncultured Cloacibacillus sp. TaxID=889794 RepID=UPI0027D94CCE|nr:hypothetical protein [uncultured Cloacibacillus sp.]
MIEGKLILLDNVPPGCCSECAANHAPDIPHNKDSLFYMYKFYAKNGRWPTWKDAMAHCPDEVKELTIKALKKHGIEVD